MTCSEKVADLSKRPCQSEPIHAYPGQRRVVRGVLQYLSKLHRHRIDRDGHSDFQHHSAGA